MDFVSLDRSHVLTVARAPLGDAMESFKAQVGWRNIRAGASWSASMPVSQQSSTVSSACVSPSPVASGVGGGAIFSPAPPLVLPPLPPPAPAHGAAAVAARVSPSDCLETDSAAHASSASASASRSMSRSSSFGVTFPLCPNNSTGNSSNGNSLNNSPNSHALRNNSRLQLHPPSLSSSAQFSSAMLNTDKSLFGEASSSFSSTIAAAGVGPDGYKPDDIATQHRLRLGIPLPAGKRKTPLELLYAGGGSGGRGADINKSSDHWV
jgi:hypothetical protein